MIRNVSGDGITDNKIKQKSMPRSSVGIVELHIGQARPFMLLTVPLISLTLFACSPTIDHRGHRFNANEVEQVQPGMTREQVALSFGTPDTYSTIGGGAYYYISTKEKTVSFFKPEIIDRRVVAVYFDETDTVSKIANYGLKDGKVIDFVSRKTPSHANDQGLIKQLFRNIGAKPKVAPQ